MGWTLGPELLSVQRRLLREWLPARLRDGFSPAPLGAATWAFPSAIAREIRGDAAAHRSPRVSRHRALQGRALACSQSGHPRAGRSPDQVGGIAELVLTLREIRASSSRGLRVPAFDCLLGPRSDFRSRRRRRARFSRRERRDRGPVSLREWRGWPTLGLAMRSARKLCAY